MTPVDVNKGGVCPVSGKPVDDSVYADYEGKRYYFCCHDCQQEFNADPAKVVAKLNAGATESAPAEGETTSGE